jgi:2'-5' RNA ligase
VLQFKRPVVELTGVSIFENEKFDVVKIDVKSKDLAAMNAKLTSDLQCTVKFPDYHAHATIAYVKPGCGKKYKGMEIKLPEDEIILSKVLYSMSDKKKITYDMPDEQGE